MNVRSILLSASLVSLVAVTACSSSSSSSDDCAQAKSIADSCNSAPSDGGASITYSFDQDKCESSDQGKTAASCIVANKSNCSCVLTCAIKGTCP